MFGLQSLDSLSTRKNFEVLLCLPDIISCRASFRSGAFVPLCQNLAPHPSPRPCEHCRRCESKTKWCPPSFLTVNFCPFLTIFRNEPLLMSFVYGKWSNTEDGEALGTRLITISWVMSNNSIPVGKPWGKQVQKHITIMEECFDADLKRAFSAPSIWTVEAGYFARLVRLPAWEMSRAPT